MKGRVLTARALRRGLIASTLIAGVALFAGPSAADHGAHISIADASGNEGEGITFTVTVTDRSLVDAVLTVDYATSNVSAQAPDDYTATSGTAEFILDDSTETITVPTVEDPIDEPDETFTVTLSNQSGGHITDATATGTIVDDDSTPTASISDASADEGDSATFNVTLSNPSTSAVSMKYTASGGSAETGDLSGSLSGTVTFPAGSNVTQQITVGTAEDAQDEANETFTVMLSELSTNAAFADSAATGTIHDDDPAPSVSIGSAAAVTEGGTASFPVTLSSPSGQTVSVNYSTTHGSTAPADFTGPTSGSVTFIPGDTSETISLPTVNDSADENDPETFTVTLSSPTNATLGTPSSGSGAINDNDPEPSLSISNVTQAEGNPPAGTTTFVFTVSLSAASGKQVTVNYATQNGTALSGFDYTHTTGSLTFSPGTTSQTIQIFVTADGVSEPNENFFVNLSSPTNATGTPSGTGTIVNDDSQPSLSIEDKTVAEGVGNASFNVTLSAASGQAVQANYSTADGPSPAATGNVDYTHQTGGLLVFAPGETTKTVTVPITQDALDEPDEKFTVSLSNESNATVSKRNGVGTIADDDGTPSVSIGNAPAVTEGAMAQFPVTLSGTSGQAVTVNYSLSHLTSTPADFSTPPPLSGSITVPAGQPSGTISIQTNDDVLDEADQETFTVTITGASGANVGSPSSGGGTINDNDVSPAVTIGNATAVTEGGSATFTVSLSAASGRQVTVGYSVAHVTTSAADFTGPTSGTVTFAASDTSETISIATVNDGADESDQETFTVSLSSPTNATLGSPSSGTGTINDNDSPPTVSIGNAAVVPEGGTASFPVTLSAQSGRTVTVNWAVVHGTTTASDLGTPLSGTVSFAPGDPLTKQVTVPTVDDTLDEGDQETFTVTLSAPTNATVGTATGTGTINDNDALPSVSIANAAPVTEGGTASFAVSLSVASGRTVTVNYSTAHGSTTSADLTGSLSGTVTFAPGDPLIKQVAIASVDDPLDEADQETFTVTLSTPSNATLGTSSSAAGTINDNDATPTVSVNDGSALEGNSGAPGTCSATPPAGTSTGCVYFTISVSAASGRTMTVQYSTSNGTAIAPSDFAAIGATTLTFAPGAPLSQTVGVRIQGDTVDEPNETFGVNLSSPSNVAIGDGQGSGAITDDDGEPALSVTGASDNEADGAIVVVSLAPASGQTVTVGFSTANGTAAAGSDYTAIPPAVSPCNPPAGAATCTLTFAPGQTSKPMEINLINDTLDEDAETFTVNLSNPVNAKILNGSDRFGIVTIQDNDPAPTVSIGDVTVTEGNGGDVNAVFPVSLSAASGRTVTVDLATANGTATAGEDYAAASEKLTFTSGQTSKTVSVAVAGDGTVEGDESFFVNLSVPTNATIADGQGVGTITNDDAVVVAPPPDSTTNTTTTTTLPTTSTTTSTTTTTGPPPPPTRPPVPPRLNGVRVATAPVTLLDNLAPIGITCPKSARGTCLGTVVVQGQARALAIVGGRPTAKTIRFGREQFVIPRGRTEKVLVSLNGRAVKAIKRSGKLKVTVVVTARDSAGKRAKAIKRSLWLKAATKKPKNPVVRP